MATEKAAPMEISMGHGNFQVLEISMAHGNFHARPNLRLDSRCTRATEERLVTMPSLAAASSLLLSRVQAGDFVGLERATAYP